jgi:hypothetical protein
MGGTAFLMSPHEGGDNPGFPSRQMIAQLPARNESGVRIVAMKILLLLCLLLGPMPLEGAEIDLGGKAAEDFDWKGYFSEELDTGSEAVRAQKAAEVVKKRVEELCARYREILKKTGDPNALKMFDEMQAHWQKSADLQVTLAGSAWGEGTGAKVAYPMQRFQVSLRRIHELKAFKRECISLNE